jgi:TIR domain
MVVYISHSRQNGSAAFRICEALDHRQVKTWLDLRELGSGANWNEKVVEAIHTADAFVFLIGPPGPDDRFQQFEWQQVVEEEYYLDSTKALIPVVIGDAEVPAFLSARKQIAVDASSIDFEPVAGTIAEWISRPEDTVDEERLQRGRQARELALKNLSKYSLESAQEDAKRAGLRGLK